MAAAKVAHRTKTGQALPVRTQTVLSMGLVLYRLVFCPRTCNTEPTQGSSLLCCFLKMGMAPVAILLPFHRKRGPFSMKTAIQIGGGNIGRGFIGMLLSQAGYQVVFADVVPALIDRLNADKAYTVHIMDTVMGCTVDIVFRDENGDVVL
jgi:hypothetical protein